ncbi:MAG: chemotaxis protein CheC [Clostridia bacterium]|nr:chemotaxis protein CheC [Clostridia bacterium]
MGTYDNLNEVQLDALKEIGNIGAGNACTALSVLLGEPVDMTIPNLQFLDFDKTAEALGGKDHMVLGIKINITDDLNGMMFHIVQKPFAEKIINTYYKRELNSFEELDEMDSSVMNEMGNITSGVYANSIASLTGLQVNITIPEQCCNTVGEILKIPQSMYSKLGERVLLVDEKYVIAGTEISSNMIMILEEESLKTLFEKIGVASD